MGDRLVRAATALERTNEKLERVARADERIAGAFETEFRQVRLDIADIKSAVGLKAAINEASQRFNHQKREPGEQEAHGLVGIFREFRMSRWWTQLIVAGVALALLFGPVGVLVAHLVAEKAK